MSLNPAKYRPAQLKKAGVALATATTEAIALGLLDGTSEKVALCVLAGLGTYGVFAVKNAGQPMCLLAGAGLAVLVLGVACYAVLVRDSRNS